MALTMANHHYIRLFHSAFHICIFFQQTWCWDAKSTTRTTAREANERKDTTREGQSIGRKLCTQTRIGGNIPGFHCQYTWDSSFLSSSKCVFSEGKNTSKLLKLMPFNCWFSLFFHSWFLISNKTICCYE